MDARGGRATSGRARFENGQSFDRPEIKTDRVSNSQATVHLEQAPAGRDRGPQMSPHYSNDDKSPLIDLLVCIVCKETMKIEKSTPGAGGTDIVQYRCRRCDRIERVRLFRRSRDAAGLKAKGK
jgi:hypothetical protein